jgi:hypothetical protein
VATLREALRLLVPGGVIVMTVPNFASFSSGYFGEHWFGLDVPRHLTHFTAETLRMTLEVAGFRVKSVRGLVHADWVRSSARRAARAGGAGLVGRLVRLKPAARMLAWCSYVAGKAEALVGVAERPA